MCNQLKSRGKGKLLQSKNNENNSMIQHFKETEKDLIEYVMESEESLKVSKHQAAMAEAASSDRAHSEDIFFVLFMFCSLILHHCNFDSILWTDGALRWP